MLKDQIKQLYHKLQRFGRVINATTLRRYRFMEIVLIWSKRKLTRFQFLVVSGIIVGFLGGLAGILLKVVVHYIQFYLESDISTGTRILLYAILPISGIVLTSIIGKYVYKNKEDVKLGQILNDIAQHHSNVDKKQMHAQIVQSAITIGLGGSAGLETPSAITGAAIGSNFAKRYRLGYKEKTLLLAGGASAGIAAAFNAPIAGVMFSFEMLLTGVVFSDFIPLVISAICGSIITSLVLNDSILFQMDTRSPFQYSNLVYYLIFALIAGFYARYYIVISEKIKAFLNKFPYGSIKKALIGGGILSVLCVAFPAVFAEGYMNLKSFGEGFTHLIVYDEVIDFFGNPSVVILVALFLSTLFKPIATAATLNSGGVGGNFAPSLIGGGLLGYTFAHLLLFLGFHNVPVINLMLVGMAGVLSGVLYAPLTGVFLIAESSFGYDLLIPLMIVSVASFLINKYFSPYNPDYEKLVRQNKIFTTRHDGNILTQIEFNKCLDADSESVPHTAGLDDIKAVFSNTNKSVIAVIDNNEKFWGMITKTQLPVLQKKKSPEELEKITAGEIAIHPNNLVILGESIEQIVQKFEESDTWYLPLIDEHHNYLGFVSRFRFLKEYRKLLKGYSE